MSEPDRAQKVLRAEEHLLWSGNPEEFEILDTTNKPVFIARCILCAAILIAAELLYTLTAVESGAGIKWGVAAFIFFACAASPILFLTRSRKLKKFTYVATDMRLIIMSDQVREIDYPRIPSCAFKTDADGHTTLLCGKRAIISKPGKWRELAFFGNPGDDGTSPCDKFAFYAVDTPEELRAVLAGKVPIDETV